MKITFGTVCVSVCSLALILNVIGLAIPYWFTGRFSSDKTNWHAGLWSYCGQIDIGKYGCVSSEEAWKSLPEARAVFGAIRAMELLGTFTCLAVLILAVIKVFNFRILLLRDQQLAKLSGVGAIIAGCFMLIGVIVCAAKKETLLPPPLKSDLHAGFVLCVVSSVLSMASGGMFFVNKEVTLPYTTQS